MFSPLAVFRVDGGPALGGGHVARCLALASAMKAAGWRCAFAVSPETAATMPALAKSGHEVWTLPADAAPDIEPGAMAGRWRDGATLLIVDHYRRDRGFELACRPWAKRILAIDDLADRKHDCDWLLDPSLGRKPDAYRPLVPAPCQFLLGPCHALLRPEFAAARPKALGRRHNRVLGRLLVSFGGTDPHDATGACLDALVRSDLDLAVDVVLGAAAPHLDRTRRRVAEYPGARLHVETAEMADLMTRADCALGGAGATSWERCCLGLPAVTAILADNQRGVATALAEAGAAVVTGDWRPDLAERMIYDLAALTPERLAHMADAAAAICDGMGIFRAVEALNPLLPGLA